jgi:hypothetical protein
MEDMDSSGDFDPPLRCMSGYRAGQTSMLACSWADAIVPEEDTPCPLRGRLALEEVAPTRVCRVQAALTVVEE